MKISLHYHLSRPKILFLVSFSFSFILITVILHFASQQDPNEEPSMKTEVLSEINPENHDSIGEKNLSTLGIVLFGFGGAGHEGGYLTDAIQVFFLDFEKANVLLLSIPRDLWVHSPRGGEMKINNILVANAQIPTKDNLVRSGASVLKKVVSEITGVPINYFLGVDFVGFERAIGINLKGIDVEVGEMLDDQWYPIKGEELNVCGMSTQEIQEVHAKYSGFELERQFTCRYKHLHFDKGLVHMEGGDALEYVRSRHGSGEGDISRGKRQQEVLTAIKNKVFSLGSLNDLPGFFNEITTYTQSDINLEIAKNIVPYLKKAREFKVIKVNISTSNVLTQAKSPNGAFILVPKEGISKWHQVQEYIQKQLDNNP